MTEKTTDTIKHLKWLIANQEAFVDNLPDGRGKDKAAAQLAAYRRELAEVQNG